MDRAGTSRTDYYAAALTALLGALAIVEGRSYRIGSLVQMGPGFFPVALGIILVFCSVLLALSARQPAQEDHGRDTIQKLDVRGAVCILGSIVAFVVLGELTGMVAAAFAAVFISSLGDRTSTLKGSIILALTVTILGALLFHNVLSLPLPLFQWGPQ